MQAYQGTGASMLFATVVDMLFATVVGMSFATVTGISFANGQSMVASVRLVRALSAVADKVHCT